MHNRVVFVGEFFSFLSNTHLRIEIFLHFNWKERKEWNANNYFEYSFHSFVWEF